jgi:hypothetical protein
MGKGGKCGREHMVEMQTTQDDNHMKRKSYVCTSAYTGDPSVKVGLEMEMGIVAGRG